MFSNKTLLRFVRFSPLRGLLRLRHAGRHKVAWGHKRLRWTNPKGPLLDSTVVDSTSLVCMRECVRNVIPGRAGDRQATDYATSAVMSTATKALSAIHGSVLNAFRAQIL